MSGFVRGLWHRPKANFAGANQNRLTLDWIMAHRSADQEIKGALIILRDRARELVRNTSWVRRYVNMLAQNVIGPKGIRLQARLRQSAGGTPMATANQRIEDAWAEWGEPGNCTVDGKLSFLDLQRLMLKNAPSDGEILLRIVRGFENSFGFALQVLDPDQLDERYDVPRIEATGNEIRMGVELDIWGRPVAYHLWEGHPSDLRRKRERKRVPAADILFMGEPDRPAQTRYIPWIASVMLDLNMLRGYFEAELVAARVAAAQGGFLTRSEDDLGDNVSESGSDQPLKMDAEPGTFTELPAGMAVTAFTPEHPTAAFPAFVKAVLRSVATGLGVSYNALANDLEGVNYSSIRAGMLDERDSYRVVQQWMIEHFHQRIYTEWLPWALLAGRLDARVPMQRYREIAWQPRGWAWVDPAADQEAAIEGIKHRLTSRSLVLGQQGLDFEEVLDDQAREEELMAARGLEVVEPEPAAAAAGRADNQATRDTLEGVGEQIAGMSASVAALAAKPAAPITIPITNQPPGVTVENYVAAPAVPASVVHVAAAPAPVVENHIHLPEPEAREIEFEDPDGKVVRRARIGPVHRNGKKEDLVPV